MGSCIAKVGLRRWACEGGDAKVICVEPPPSLGREQIWRVVKRSLRLADSLPFATTDIIRVAHLTPLSLKVGLRRRNCEGRCNMFTVSLVSDEDNHYRRARSDWMHQHATSQGSARRSCMANHGRSRQSRKGPQHSASLECEGGIANAALKKPSGLHQGTEYI